MILLMASIIWLSVHGKTSKIPLQRESIKETGGGWGTDVCKCNGNVSMIYWQGESPNIVYCKVGYVKFGMAGLAGPPGMKAKYAEKWGTPKGDAHTFDNSCAEFYHGNILRAFEKASPYRRRCKDWIFCNIPNSLSVYFGNTVYDIPASEFRIGIAGCAEIFARAYVLDRIKLMHSSELVTIRFASNGEVENIPDDIPESGWSYMQIPNNPSFSPWGKKSGEVFEFTFNIPDKDYTATFEIILNALDDIFKKWGSIDGSPFSNEINPATIVDESLNVINNNGGNAVISKNNPAYSFMNELVNSETKRWRSTLNDDKIPDVIAVCMTTSIADKYTRITDNMKSTDYPYSKSCPPGI